jgi:hypothetical protein
MKRPLSVTIMSFVFIIAGVSGIVYHFADLKNATEITVAWVLFVRLLAVAGGWFAFRGRSWARWLLLAWIVYHVYVSLYHTIDEIAIHVVFTMLTLFALFNKKANAYFRRGWPSKLTG